MADMDWYRRYPAKWIGGTRKMTFEERGAYADILELLYLNGGRVEDDDTTLAALMACNPRTWRYIKRRLVEIHKKLSIIDGFISNEKCREVLEERSNFISKCTQGGVKSGHKRAKTKTCNEPPSNHYTTLQDNKKDSPPPSVGTPRRVAPCGAVNHGTRLTSDWLPSESDLHWARSRGLDEETIRSSLEEFHDYWEALPDGRQARKKEWGSTWRNSIRHGFGVNRNSGKVNGREPYVSPKARIATELYREMVRDVTVSDKDTERGNVREFTPKLISLQRGS